MKCTSFLLILTALLGIGCSSQPLNPDRVDNQTVNGKFLFGYQGWYSAPGDGSPLNRWQHWTLDGKKPTAQNISVALWPDLSEADPNERFQTQLKLPDGKFAQVFSSYRYETVRRHFDWMKTYGLDGVLLQRFVNQVYDADTLRFMNAVLANVIQSAGETGRVFAIMYDLSGANPETVVNDIIRDWTSLVDNLNITKNDRYIHHRGLPVLGIWGIGFSGRPIKPQQISQLLDWFDRAPQEYKVTLLGGVPAFWRTDSGEASVDPDWDKIYRRFTILSPWIVGWPRNLDQVNEIVEKVIKPDLKVTQPLGMDYMPTVFPGFSMNNLKSRKGPETPRLEGKFYWKQIYEYINAGSTMLYGAMFDELDEGTSIMKCATKNQSPVSPEFVTPSSEDLYLKLSGSGTRALNKSEPLKSTMEYKKPPDLMPGGH